MMIKLLLTITFLIICLFVVSNQKQYYEGIPRSRKILYRDFAELERHIYKYNYEHPDAKCSDLKQLIPDYITEIPKDTWGTEIRYDSRAGYIYSAGPDGQYGDVNNMELMEDNVCSFFEIFTKLEKVILFDKNSNKEADNGDILEAHFFGRILQYSSDNLGIIDADNFSFLRIRTYLYRLKN